MSGMTTFDNLRSLRTYGFVGLVAGVTVVAIIFSWPPAFYHQTQLKSPYPEFTYDKEAGKINSALSSLNLLSTDRIYFHPSIGPFGHVSSLSVGVGQVALNDNFNPKNYRDWTFYKRTGIEPKENWAGYPGDFGKYYSWLVLYG